MKLQIILVVLLACICLSAKPARRTKNGEGFVSNVKETSEHTKKELQKLLDGTKSEEKAFDKKEVEGKQTEDKESCTPGESFMIDCNNCYCPPSGLRRSALCTLKGCQPFF